MAFSIGPVGLVPAISPPGWGGTPFSSARDTTPPPGWDPVVYDMSVMGGLGGIPTAADKVQRGSVPRYFAQPPQGLGALSPLALAYLSRMFPQRLWGEDVSPYTITPYAAAQPEVRTEPSGIPGMAGHLPEGEVVKTAVEEVPEVKGETEKVSPRAPSAQLFKRLQEQGAVPNLRQYVEDILEIPWESYIGTIQAYWPSEQKRRSPTWRTTRQL